MTPEEFAKLQRDYLIGTEKESAVLIAAAFGSVKRDIQRFLINNSKVIDLRELSFIEKLIAEISLFLDNLSLPFSRIVSNGQKKVIDFTSKVLADYLSLDRSIFSPDKEAIQILIGRTQTGESLQKFFLRMKPDIAEKTKQSLLEGFALGESNQQIAKRITDVSDVSRYRAMVITRNETVMAYRNASTEFYDDAGITEYRFMSALDVRTCLVCWRLHGTKWKLKTKPHIHTQCRCTVLPVLSGEKVETGIERFDRLETGYQKQILGGKRYELFQNGAKLEDFTGVKKSEDFGQTHFIKPLSDLVD